MDDGRTTRGKTLPGRLARLDRWLLDRDLDGVDRIVDVGWGATPVTTLELFDAARARWPEVEVLGVDIDPERVEAAQPLARPGLRFERQGFDLRLDRPVAVIRAMNVLRAYRPERAAEAHAHWGSLLVDGGLLLEGTTDAEGGTLVCHVLRREGDALRREALLFSADGGRGFAPLMLRDHLPRDLRGQTRAGLPLRAFFDRWTAAWQAVREPGMPPGTAFARSVEELGRRGEPIGLESGLAAWRPTGGVPTRVDG